MTMKCPPCPPPQTLPGKDFSTPENAFEYLREAVVKGQTDDSYAWHEFLAFSEQMKKDKKVTREDYFFARKDVVADPPRADRPARVGPGRRHRVS